MKLYTFNQKMNERQRGRVLDVDGRGKRDRAFIYVGGVSKVVLWI